MQTSCSSLFVSNHQFWICISFSQNLLAFNVQTPGWRVVPFIALWVNSDLGGGRLKPASAPSVCVCLIKVCLHFPLSLCLANLWIETFGPWNHDNQWPCFFWRSRAVDGHSCWPWLLWKYGCAQWGDDWCHGVMWVVKSLLTREGECCHYTQETGRFMGDVSISFFR